MKKLFLLVFLLLLLPWQLQAATYYVRPDGDNTTCDGLSNEAAGDGTCSWLTIGKCASTMVAGDTCIVTAGTYNESVNPTNVGTSGSRITYQANAGDTVVTRQWFLKDYMTIDGFEITHTDTTYNRAIIMTSGPSYGRIINNYIHHTYGSAIYYSTSGTLDSDHNAISNNRFEYIGCYGAGAGEWGGAYTISITIYGDERQHHNLIEKNYFRYMGVDAIQALTGEKNIVRNNIMRDASFSYFPDAVTTTHIDSWQAYGYCDKCVLDSNLILTNMTANGHGFLANTDTANSGMILRGNVMAYLGSYGIYIGGPDNTRSYNNTFVNVSSSYVATYVSRLGNYSTGNKLSNNIFYDCSGSGSILINAQSPNELTAGTNACESSPAHASCTVTANIDFSDYAANVFKLAATSDALGAGAVLTTVTSANGSGTSFVVGDASFFVSADWGVVDATGAAVTDTIKVGSNDPVAITAINYDTNTITVASSQTWTQGDGVHLAKYYNGTTVDIGAYGYPTTGFRRVVVTKAGIGQGEVYSTDAQFLCGSLCETDYIVYKIGDIIRLKAAEISGMGDFTSWSGSGCSGTGDCDITVSAGEGDIEVTATFGFGESTSYALSLTKSGPGLGLVTSSPEGINCGGTCSYNYLENTEVTLTAAPNSGWSFGGWSGAGCSGTGTCVVTMTEAKAVDALFSGKAAWAAP